MVTRENETAQMVSGALGHLARHMTTGCPRAKMNQLPIIGKSILITILTHGRNPDAIADSDASNSQGIK